MSKYALKLTNFKQLFCFSQLKTQINIWNSYGNFLKAEHGATWVPEGFPTLPVILVADFKFSKFAQPSKAAFNRPATSVKVGFWRFPLATGLSGAQSLSRSIRVLEAVSLP